MTKSKKISKEGSKSSKKTDSSKKSKSSSKVTSKSSKSSKPKASKVANSSKKPSPLTSKLQGFQASLSTKPSKENQNLSASAHVYPQTMRLADSSVKGTKAESNQLPPPVVPDAVKPPQITAKQFFEPKQTVLSIPTTPPPIGGIESTRNGKHSIIKFQTSYFQLLTCQLRRQSPLLKSLTMTL